MIYTYEISLNSSDYVSLYPTNHPKITTERDGWICRDSVDKFKINESLNETVYGLLETWFDTPAAFAYDNFIRIKKSGSVKYTFKFNAKECKPDFEHKTILVEPEIYDQYTDIYHSKARLADSLINVPVHYNDEDEAGLDNVLQIHTADIVLYEGHIKTGGDSAIGVLNAYSDNTYSAQSAFLWNDNYPDETSPGANNYISSDSNYLNSFAISRDNQYNRLKLSIEDSLNIPKAFQCSWFCASDYTIHFEHVRWFEDQIADYQLDLTGSDYYDNTRRFEYSIPEILNAEYFFFPTDNEASDYDNVQITYDQTFKNSYEKEDVRLEYDAYITSDFADFAKFIIVGDDELAVGYRGTPATNGNWVSFTNSGPDITVGEADGADNYAYTNYMSPTAVDLDYSITVSYTPSISNLLTAQGYNGASPVGSPVNLSEGANTGTFSACTNIRISGTGAQEFTYTMSVTSDDATRIPWEAGNISSTSRQNNYLSWANIVDRFWRYGRYSETGIMNQSSETFESTKFNKEQAAFKFYYADDIDPMRGIKTDYGTGMIMSMTRDLETDWITIKLRYNE